MRSGASSVCFQWGQTPAHWGVSGDTDTWLGDAALISNCYGMREALAILGEEGLKASWDKHERMHHKLWDGLGKLGLKPFVEGDNDRLATVNTIKVSSGLYLHMSTSSVGSACHDLLLPCRCRRASTPWRSSRMPW